MLPVDAKTAIDWYSVVVGLLGVLLGVLSWVFVQTVGWIRKLNERFDEHVEADRANLSDIIDRIGDVKDTLNRNKDDIMDRINQRREDYR